MKSEVSILISVDSGLILRRIANIFLVACKFQSLFQWIPVLYMLRLNQYHPVLSVSILISVDSGLIRYTFVMNVEVYNSFNPYFSGFRSYTYYSFVYPFSVFSFQSLFQWIPVLYFSLLDIQTYYSPRFNPYFSGFRSYTLQYK